MSGAGMASGGAPLLEVRDLTVTFADRGGQVRAVDGVTARVQRSESVALVGESGSGKTTLLRAVLGLLPAQATMSGSISIGGRDLVGLSEHEFRQVRGGEIGFIFQDPVNCFNPSMSVGAQLRRVVRLRRPGLSRTEQDTQIRDMLARVGVDARAKLSHHSFQFSQGQLQRVMIAAACLAGRPSLLLADEPTTSLDVTMESQILGLLRRLRADFGMSLLLVTHNLAVAAQICDRAMVMYGGRVVEEAAITDLFEAPSHPYTRQLLKSLPKFPHEGGRLCTMKGEAGAGPAVPRGCGFLPRCNEVIGDICSSQDPVLVSTGTVGQRAACHWYGPGAAQRPGVG